MRGDIQDLVERCIRREEKAWKGFIERFSGLLYYSAQERLRRSGFAFGSQDVEDIVQMVFLEIWQKTLLEKLRERRKIKGWLSVMAQTRALNYMRKKKERLLRQEDFYKLDNIKAETDSPVEEKVTEEVEKVIESFDARDRIILKLSIFHKKTHRYIARFMNIPVNTVSTVMARKKKALRKKLNIFERKSG